MPENATGNERINAITSVFRIVLIIGILFGLLILNVSCSKHVTLNLEYQVDLSQLGNKSTEQIMSEVFDVITSRVSDYHFILGAGTSYSSGSNIIYVHLYGITDVDSANKLITTRGWIDFREMVYDSYGNPVLDANGNYTWQPAKGVINCQAEQLTGQYVKDVTVVIDQHSDTAAIVIDFNTEEAILLEQITKRLFVSTNPRLDKSLGVFLDGQLISSLKVNAVVSDECRISGLSLEEARNLKSWLKSGPLPVPVNLVSSTLSDD